MESSDNRATLPDRWSGTHTGTTDHRVSGVAATVLLVGVASANFFPGSRLILGAAFLVALLLPFVSKSAYWGHRGINLCALLLMSYTVISMLAHPLTVASFYNGVVAAMCYALVVCLSTYSPHASSLSAFIRQMSMVSRVLILSGLVYDLVGGAYLYGKSGTLFVLSFFVMADHRLRRGSKLIFLVATLYQAYFSDDRGILAVAAVMLGTFLIWPALRRGRLLRALFLTAIFALLVLVPLGYVWLANSEHRSWLEVLSLEYTRARFFSGREVVWQLMLSEAVEANLLFGGGQALSPSDYGVDLSAHNTFVVVLARSGVIGLILFFALLLALFKGFAVHMDDPLVKASAIYAVAILVRQSTEYELIGNNLAISILSWVVIAMGVVKVNSLRREQRDMRFDGSVGGDSRTADDAFARRHPNR